MESPIVAVQTNLPVYTFGQHLRVDPHSIVVIDDPTPVAIVDLHDPRLNLHLLLRLRGDRFDSSVDEDTGTDLDDIGRGVEDTGFVVLTQLFRFGWGEKPSE